MSDTESKWTFGQKFYVDFNATASELSSRLNALKNSRDASPTTIQALTSDISRLTKSLSDAIGSLPSYDQRQCELQLKALEKSVEELRGSSASAPTFSFKRKAAKTRPLTKPSPMLDPLSKSETTRIKSAKILASFSYRYLTISDVRFPDSSAELSISDLDNCIVNLLPDDEHQTKITAFHIQRASRSIILLPRIAGSIILHDLSDSVIVVGCHQFRMHDSTGIDVYLECLSDPIIEHCSNIRFASYPNTLVHGGPLQDSTKISVKDFSHILPTPSPNWTPLLEEGCEKSWPVISLQGEALQREIKRLLAFPMSEKDLHI